MTQFERFLALDGHMTRPLKELAAELGTTVKAIKSLRLRARHPERVQQALQMSKAKRRADPEKRAKDNAASRAGQAKRRATPEGRARLNDANRRYRSKPEGRASCNAINRRRKASPEGRAYQNARRATPLGKAETFAREQLKRALALGAKKQARSLDYLGCCPVWLAETYLPNHPHHPGEGVELHVDHVRALSAFDLTDQEQLRQACHWSNLRPLSAAENLSRGNNPVPGPELEEHLAYVASMESDRRPSD